MTKWTYSATRSGYEKLWNTISIKGGKDDTNASFFAKKIIANANRYKNVERSTGVPWYLIGALHMRESGCSFAGVLHNGEQIIGKNRKTRLVPAGRGPFVSWIEAAIDALTLKNLQQYKGQWTPALMAYVSEIYNGLGYVGKGIHSPYVWAGSNHEERGKYVADHVWDKNFDDPQIGTMTVIKRIAELEPEVAQALNVKPPMSTTKKVIVGGGLIVGGATGGTVATTDVATEVGNSTVDTMNQLMPVFDFFRNYGPVAFTALVIAVVIGVVGYKLYQRSKENA